MIKSAKRKNWTREQLLVAFNLYCQIPFGKLHSRNPDIIRFGALIDRTPSALAMKLVNIASLDPVITSSGRKGLSSVSSLDREMWEEMSSDWNSFVEKSESAIASLTNNTFDPKPLADNQDYTGKTKLVQKKARIGQRFFRNSVLSSYDWRCCITGLSQPALLNASHIIPWKDCTENRLNPRNGLALSALHDRAFDLGIISIKEDFTIMVSSKYFQSDDVFSRDFLVSFDGKKIYTPEKFSPDKLFLEYHNDNIF